MVDPIIDEPAPATPVPRELKRSSAPLNPYYNIRLAGFVICLGFLSLLHVAGIDLEWQTENVLAVLFASSIAAWFFVRWQVQLWVLGAELVWLATDLQRDPRWWQQVIHFEIRIVVILLIVTGISKARKRLDRALRIARVDSLTGLPNRRAILEMLDAELCRLNRFGRPFCLALLDADGFKTINDQQGHLAGDRALQDVAAALRKQTRGYDGVGRLGGDEFVVIFSETPKDETPPIIDRLRSTLRNETASNYPSLTFSIGVLTVLPEDHLGHPLTPLDCIKLADEAMYDAKRRGPDQTRIRSITEQL